MISSHSEEHRRQLQQARQALAARHFDEAARSFAIAYALNPSPEILLQLAQSEQSAEHLEAAILLLRRLQSEGRDPKLAQQADTMLLELRPMLGDTEPNQTQILRGHLDNGKRAFQAQAFSLVLESYALAYSIKRLPRLLFNMAQAARRANQLQLALLLYRRLLAEEPNSPVRNEAAGYIAELEPLVDKPPIYKRPLFWGLLGGGVAAAALSIGLGVGLARRDPSTDGGNLSFHFPSLLQTR